jgi:hypothetical protein
MTTLTVFLAPPGLADGALAALTDLSAAALVDEFAWVCAPNGGVDRLHLVAAGVGRDIQLGELVAARRTTALRICTLVPAVAGHRRLEVVDEHAAVTRLQNITGAQRVVRLRALLALGTEVDGAASDLAVDGWHNVLIAPEDARGPGYGAVPWDTDAGPAELGRCAAPGLAALTGLWRSLPHAPLDDQPPLPGHVLRLARSFYRRLDTAEVEQRLRAEVLAQGRVLPVPSDRGSQIVEVHDVGAATAAMAGALWRKHAWVLRGPRLPYRSAQTEQIGAWQVITMFFAFLWASLRNAPAAWARGVIDNVSSRVALGTAQLVFDGAPNVAFEVVVNGRTASGGYAGWADVGAATAQLTGAASGGEHQLTGHDDLSMVWQDFAAGAFTLADAGQRSVDLPPIKMGPMRAVVSGVADLVPGPAERFSALPGPVAAAVQTAGVDAADPLGIADLQNRLGELQGHADLALPARAALGDLDAWQRTGARSYGAAVGRQLAQAFYDARAEVQELLRRVQSPPRLPEETGGDTAAAIRWLQMLLLLLTGLALGAAVTLATLRHWDPAFPLWATVIGGLTALLAVLVAIGMVAARSPSGKDDPNSAFGRWIQVWVVLYLVFVEVAIMLVDRDVHAWWTTLLVCLGVLVLLLVCSGIAFISTQRRLFALLHQRQSVAGRYEIDKQNLWTAARDLRRLTEAYRQYLSWSRAVGSFLQAPLGPDRSRREQRLRLSWGLPMSTGVATTNPPQPVVAEVAGHVRHQLFRPGWLSGSWENLLIGALPPLPGLSERGADASPFWREPGFGTGTPLDRWSTALYQGQVTSTGADMVWREALRLLAGPMNGLVPRLVGTVEQVGGAAMPVAEFLVGLDGGAAPSGVFGDALFTDGAKASGKTRVAADGPPPQVMRDGLGLVCAVTQFSEALSLEELRSPATEAAAADAQWSGTPAPEPGVAPQRAAPPAARNPFQVPEFGGGIV